MPALNLQANVTPMPFKRPPPRGFEAKYLQTNLRKKLKHKSVITHTAKVITIPIIQPHHISPIEEQFFFRANEAVLNYLSQLDLSRPEQEAEYFTMIALAKYLTIKSEHFDQQSSINIPTTSQQEKYLLQKPTTYAQHVKNYRAVSKQDYQLETTDPEYWQHEAQECMKRHARMRLVKGLKKLVVDRKINEHIESKSRTLFCEEVLLGKLKSAYLGHVSKKAYIEDLGEYLFTNMSDLDYADHNLKEIHWLCQCGFKPGFDALISSTTLKDVRTIGSSEAIIKAFRKQSSMLEKNDVTQRTNFFMCIVKESIRQGKLALR
jgi:hypothetical protein